MSFLMYNVLRNTHALRGVTSPSVVDNRDGTREATSLKDEQICYLFQLNLRPASRTTSFISTTSSAENDVTSTTSSHRSVLDDTPRTTSVVVDDDVVKHQQKCVAVADRPEEKREVPGELTVSDGHGQLTTGDNKYTLRDRQ